MKLFSQIFLISLFLCSCAHHQSSDNKKITARFIQSGEYIATTMQKKMYSDAASVKGETVRANDLVPESIKWVSDDHKIKVKIGTRFGVMYQIISPHPNQPIELRNIQKRPLMIKNGKANTGSEIISYVYPWENNGITLDGYSIETPAELVEGRWIFEVWHDNDLLIIQEFTTEI